MYDRGLQVYFNTIYNLNQYAFLTLFKSFFKKICTKKLSTRFRRRPTFAGHAIIGADGLNCRVRDGIGCGPVA